MTDYRDMYFRMFKATEEAIRLLVKVQQECEELYLRGSDGFEKQVELPLKIYEIQEEEVSDFL